MFKLNLFNTPFNFWKQAAAVNAPENTKQPINNNNKIDKTKVISMNHNEEGDFVEVDIKKLSYAEVAALSRTSKPHQIKHDGNKGNNNNKDKVDGDDVVDVNELEREVTDYQMSSVLSKNVLRKQVDVLDNAVGDVDDESMGLDEEFNDKSNRRSKKSKFLKKGK